MSINKEGQWVDNEYENPNWLDNWLKSQSKKFQVYWNNLLNGVFPQTNEKGDVLKDSEGNAKFIKRKSLVERLDISREGLTGDLKIDDWANLKVLNVGDNELTSLEISNCPKLERIICSHNGKKVLEEISDSEVKVREENPTLKKLTITNCPNAKRIYASYNDLQELNLSSLPKLKYLFCGNNPKLTNQNIKIPNTAFLADSATFSEGEVPRVDAQIYVDNLLLMDHLGNHLTPEEVTELDLTECDLQGHLSLARFPNLESLDLSDNFITSLDLSNCHNLKSLECSNNQLTNLDISDCENLKYLDASNNQIEEPDFLKGSKLETISLNNNKLTYFDDYESLHDSLKELYLTANSLGDKIPSVPGTVGYLDVAGYKNLESLNCAINELKELQLHGNTKLKNLICYKNKIKSLKVNHLKELESLYCYKDKLEEIDCSNLKNLKELYCANNFFTYELDGEEEVSHTLKVIKVQGCDNLEILDCAENSIEELDVSNLKNLNNLSCKENPYLFVLKIEDCPNLEYLDCSRIADVSMDCDLLINNCPKIRLLFCDEDSSINLKQFPNLELVEIGKYEETVDDDGDSYDLYKIIGTIDFIANRNIEKIKNILANSDSFSWNDLANIDKKDLYGVPSDLREKLVSLIVKKYNEEVRRAFELSDENEDEEIPPPSEEPQETPDSPKRPSESPTFQEKEPEQLPTPPPPKSEPDKPILKNKDEIIRDLNEEIAKLQAEVRKLKSEGKTPDSQQIEKIKKEIEEQRKKINNSDLDEDKKKELLKRLEELAKKNEFIINNETKSSPISNNYHWAWLLVGIGWVVLVVIIFYQQSSKKKYKIHYVN